METPGFYVGKDGTGVVEATYPTGRSYRFLIAPHVTQQALGYRDLTARNERARQRYMTEFDERAHTVTANATRNTHEFFPPHTDAYLEHTATLTVALSSHIEPARVIAVLNALYTEGRRTTPDNPIVIITGEPEARSEVA